MRIPKNKKKTKICVHKNYHIKATCNSLDKYQFVCIYLIHKNTTITIIQILRVYHFHNNYKPKNMNKIGFIVLIASAYGEPLQLTRQRLLFDDTQNIETISDNNAASAPYSSSGWKPTGQLLAFPAKHQSLFVSNNFYGAPSLTESAEQTTAENENNTTEIVDAEENESTTSSASDSSEVNDITEEPDSENVDVEDIPVQVVQKSQNPLLLSQSPEIKYVPFQRFVYIYTPPGFYPAYRQNNEFSGKLNAQQPVVYNSFTFQQPISYSYSSSYPNGM